MTALERVPSTMRVAMMYDAGDIRIEERPVPQLQPGDVLVRMGASGVCSGDLMPWYVRRKAPFVFGHEPAGTVVAVAGRATVAVGDRVFVHHHAACLTCEACRAGRFVHCRTWRATALEPGGMAEFVRVPSANLSDTLVLPEHVPFRDGSLVEPLGCVIKSLRRAFARELGGVANLTGPARPLEGSTLYVIGAGVMGLMHVVLARHLGATVYASDYNPSRLALAEGLGASATFGPAAGRDGLAAATAGRLADAVICGPGSPAALEAAVAAAGADATVVMFTPLEPNERFAFDQSTAYFRDVRLVASYSCGPADTREALGLIGAGIVTAAILEATEFPFPAVEAAYAAMTSAAVVKAIVLFS